ncbi:MAG: hypothetical protein EXS22_02905 [Pedosphaera sp.]|nr:hypothetical protein [Pedosphaera sp.]MSU42973.1 hypothetical protein [Pedosphaera sp.]
MSTMRGAFLILCCCLSVLSAAEQRPVLQSIEPRGIQRGTTSEFALAGTNAGGLTVEFSDKRITGKLIAPPANATAPWRALITVPAELGRSTHEVWLKNSAGESAQVKLHIDDIAQVIEPKLRTHPPAAIVLPAAYWGALDTPGDTDRIAFDAQAGQTIVFHLQAKSIGSKASELLLALLDSQGRVLASSREQGEPFLAHLFTAAGRHFIQITDLQRSGSSEHYYRLTAGALPFVTGFYPPAIALNRQTKIQLAGHNLQTQEVEVKATAPGEFSVPLDPARLRVRSELKAIVTAEPDALEQEPNDQPAQSQTLAIPAAVSARIWGSTRANDADHFRFAAKAGTTLVMETIAARRGSPVDTRLDVLFENGQPVPRAKLQAVRNSALNFRPINSTQLDARVDHWEEMSLNEYLYMEGEVVKLFRAPEGPDSGFRFYSSTTGARRCFFDTSAAAHADSSPCYIVQPFAPGAALPDNGLPVFALNYTNDDDGLRQWGTDSRLFFTAPRDGHYVVRVTDNRNRHGALYSYRLLIRAVQPDFKVTLTGENPVIAPGTGKGFTVKAERLDGFDGPIRVELPALPSGLHITQPLLIEAGHTEAHGVIFAANDMLLDKPIVLAGNFTATAMVGGTEVRRTINGLGTVNVSGKSPLFLGLESEASLKARMAVVASNATNRFGAGTPQLQMFKPLEITLVPGKTASIWLALQRVTDKGLQDISVANLPHGVIVDSIGLNGVEIAEDQDRREVFLHCAPWVQEMDRICFAVLGGTSNVVDPAGKQTALPVLLKIRRQ